MMKENTCFFTGHRVIPMTTIPKLERELDLELDRLCELGVTNFVCGGALGFDMLAEEAVIRLKDRAAFINLILELPYPDWNMRWPEAQRQRLIPILRSTDDARFAAEDPSTNAMFLRDRRMVEQSHFGISYLTRSPSGTSYTVRYAIDCGCDVINLAERVR